MREGHANVFPPGEWAVSDNSRVMQAGMSHAKGPACPNGAVSDNAYEP